MGIGIIIRASRVENRTIQLARSLMRSTTYTVFLALDERDVEWDTFEITKLSISTSSLDRLGLPIKGINFAWQCGDYALYLAHTHSPHLSSFWLVEEDVYINLINPLAFFERVDKLTSSDLLVANLQIADHNWFWYEVTSRFYNRVFRCLFPVVRVSQAAVVHLLEERQRQEVLLCRHEMTPDQIPNDEGFVASALVQRAFAVADLNDIAELYSPESFSFGDLINRHMLPGNSVLYHPVAEGTDYVQRLARNDRTSIESIIKASVADPALSLTALRPEVERRLIKSLLANQGRSCFSSDDNGLAVMGRMLEGFLVLHEMTVSALASLGMSEGLLQVVETAILRLDAARNTRVNLAFGKSADQSSTCIWSCETDKERDASLLVDGQISNGLYNHTDHEIDPWWMVDLGTLDEITGLLIYNRRGFEDRSRGLSALISVDNLVWESVFEHSLAEDPDEILTIDFPRPRFARYVKLSIPGKTILNLVQVQVLSKPLKCC